MIFRIEVISGRFKLQRINYKCPQCEKYMVCDTSIRVSPLGSLFPLTRTCYGKETFMLFEAGAGALLFLVGLCFFGEVGGLGFFGDEVLLEPASSDESILALLGDGSGVGDR
jgi:hypothetical protein